MSGICGFVGEPLKPSSLIERMLEPILYRGDRSNDWIGDGVGLGYRWWTGRPGKSPRIDTSDQGIVTACCGTLAPSVASPAMSIQKALQNSNLSSIDGAFAAASWDASTRTLTLLRDPFGVRSLFYTEHGGSFYFASELKQLLNIPGLSVELDPAAIHRYLTFSFVPGDVVPIKGIRRLLPGNVLTYHAGSLSIVPYFTLREQIDETLQDQATAAKRIFQLGRQAIQKRLNGEHRVGLYLSGGIDSSAVGVWLKQAGAPFEAFHLDFGPESVDRESVADVAGHLGIEVQSVEATSRTIAPILEDLVYKMDLPFGDAVCGPHYLLALAAKERGLAAVFNGEGGDQLFGGWTSKPMVAAALYAGLFEEESPEEQYLRSYHRFYGLEDELYTPEFKSNVGGPGQRRAFLHNDLHGPGTLLSRVRLTDIHLKGSQNILPRAERIGNAHGLDVRVPLFDRQLAEAAFALPPALKLHGACEKYVLKLAMQHHLPEDIVWRRKFGMSVPVTDWLLGVKGSNGKTALTPFLEGLLGPTAVKKRGLFRPDYVERLKSGRDEPTVNRRRRVGEKLWALMILELWLRRYIDRKGIP